VVYSENIIILQLIGTSIDINLIQVYTPIPYAYTADKQDNNAAQFYEQLRDALQTTERKLNKTDIKKYNHFNAKVGCGATEKIVRKYSLGDRNDREDIQFCLKKEYHQKHKQ